MVLIQYDEAVYTAHLDTLVEELRGAPDRLVNKLAQPVGVVHAALRAHGFPQAAVMERIDSPQTEAIDLGAAVDPHTVIARLKANPPAGVLHAQPNFLYHPLQVSADYTTDQTANPDPDRTKAWHLKAIQLREAWDVVWDSAPARPPGAGPITIGVLDSGIAFSDQDLAGKKRSVTACLDEDGTATTCDGGRDFVGTTHDADPTPNFSDHGSLVAAVAAGEFNNGQDSFGVAQDVELVGIRVFDTGSFTTLDIVQGVNFARHNQLDIINVSLGLRHTYQSCTDYSMTPANTLVVEYQALQDYPDGLFVVAAGNWFEESGGADIIVLPADFASAVSLGGVQCWAGLDNDAISSLILRAGYTVQVFRHSDFQGARLTYAGPQAVDLTGTSLDNQISSYKFYVTPETASAEALVFRERGLSEAGGWEIAHNEPVEVGWLWEDNDAISSFRSLQVGAGYTVQVFRHSYFRGARLTYVGPQAVDLTGTSLDNQISSYKFYVTPATAPAEALVFRERGLDEAGGWEIAHTDAAEVGWLWEDNDAITSLRIGAGYTVEVFRDSYFQGAGQTYVGPQAVELSGQGLDNQISSYRFSVTP